MLCSLGIQFTFFLIAVINNSNSNIIFSLIIFTLLANISFFVYSTKIPLVVEKLYINVLDLYAVKNSNLESRKWFLLLKMLKRQVGFNCFGFCYFRKHSLFKFTGWMITQMMIWILSSIQRKKNPCNSEDILKNKVLL
ncbi:uncharacterized protein [Centruroides vittatus]|uniref:uncharacterized protein isoform X1 n=1 Tax=Centruroides vittatus TaxID=120091 RepID=UPI00350FD06D